jgi:hypothetical protein
LLGHGCAFPCRVFLVRLDTLGVLGIKVSIADLFGTFFGLRSKILSDLPLNR